LKRLLGESGSLRLLGWLRGGVWYTHFVLKKTVELTDEYECETVIAIDRGEVQRLSGSGGSTTILEGSWRGRSS